MGFVARSTTAFPFRIPIPISDSKCTPTFHSLDRALNLRSQVRLAKNYFGIPIPKFHYLHCHCNWTFTESSSVAGAGKWRSHWRGEEFWLQLRSHQRVWDAQGESTTPSSVASGWWKGASGCSVLGWFEAGRENHKPCSFGGHKYSFQQSSWMQSKCRVRQFWDA